MYNQFGPDLVLTEFGVEEGFKKFGIEETAEFVAEVFAICKEYGIPAFYHNGASQYAGVWDRRIRNKRKPLFDVIKQAAAN